MSARLDQVFDMLHSFMEFTQHNHTQEGLHEHRVVMGHEDRMRFPKGIRLEFPHFESTNPVGWVFKATQFFEFHKNHPIKNLL